MSRRSLRPAAERLSSQDAGYLRRETPTQPLHFSILMLVAPGPTGPVSLEDVRRHVAARIGRMPWLRRRITRAPGGVGPFFWVPDPAFTVERHVSAATANACAGDPDRLLRDVTAEMLPRDRPLWQLVVADPLPDGRTPIALAVHHALMDGGLFAETMRGLFGLADDDATAAETDLGRHPSGVELLAAAGLDRLRGQVRRHRRPPVARLAAAPSRRDAPLAGTVTGGRVVAARTLPLAELRELRVRTGATINDLYLAAATAGLRAAVVDRNLDAATLLALVPRDARREEESRTAGNRTWSMYVDLPVAVEDPRRRLALIREATETGKRAPESAGNADFRFDVALTNVPVGGPHRLGPSAVEITALTLPLQGSNRIAAIALSQDDRFTVTWTADAAGFPDLDRIADAAMAEFARLTREARVP